MRVARASPGEFFTRYGRGIYRASAHLAVGRRQDLGLVRRQRYVHAGALHSCDDAGGLTGRHRTTSSRFRVFVIIDDFHMHWRLFLPRVREKRERLKREGGPAGGWTSRPA